MAVENHPVNEGCKIGSDYRAWCWNKPRTRKPYRVAIHLYDDTGNYAGSGSHEIPPVMSLLCRQLGERTNGGWVERDECRGCSPDLKDHEYISRMRGLHEEEMRQKHLHKSVRVK